MSDVKHTEEWARERERPFVHHWHKTPHNPEYCCASVPEGGRSVLFHQCRRAPKVWYGSLGYCSQHDPVAADARHEAKKAQWAADEQSRTNRRATEAHAAAFGKAAVAALKEIAAGHNDPRSLAQSVLREHGEDAP